MRPFCVSGGMRSDTRPLSVGTVTSPPSMASCIATGRSTRRSSPSRVKKGCGFTRTRRYASPGGPPPTPGLPWPARRMRWPSFTPGGIFTVSRLAGWPFSREIWITCSDPLYASGRVISTSPSTSSPCLARDRVRVRVRPNTSSASPKPPFAAWPKRVRKKSENPLASSPNGLSPGCPVYTYWKPPVPEGRPRPCANCSHSGPTVSYRFRFSGSLRTS